MTSSTMLASYAVSSRVIALRGKEARQEHFS